jgi:hypothetical protein
MGGSIIMFGVGVSRVRALWPSHFIDGFMAGTGHWAIMNNQAL